MELFLNGVFLVCFGLEFLLEEPFPQMIFRSGRTPEKVLSGEQFLRLVILVDSKSK
jgi:hypothetical protein